MRGARRISGAVAIAFTVGALAARPVQPIPADKKTGFTAMSPPGLRFTNQLDQTEATANANLMNGSGVALGDYDGDGWCDVYFCGLSNDNKLFKNEGNWRFRDVTAEAGVECPGLKATGAVFADINGDGKLDLLVSSMGGPHACFINQGGGKFSDTIATSGITSRLGGTSMALADVDGNGTLDLYMANYGATSILRSGGALNIGYVNGKPVVRGRYAQRIKIIDGTMFELGEPDSLYLNDGKGVFKTVSWTDGAFLDEEGKRLAEAPWDQGLSVMFYDVNDDGAPDIYVCNDAFTPDRFWINDGTGKFRAVSHRDWRVTSHFSMGADFGDLNRDGSTDFMVVDMLSREPRYLLTQKGNMPAQPRSPGQEEFQFQARRNTLYENRGDGSFAEIANFAGVAASEWSWSCVFLDVDLDGWEDVLVSNGFPHNMDDLDTKEKIRAMGKLGVEQSRRTTLMFPPLLTPNIAFRNAGGMRFEEVGARWGFNSTNISNGFACGDLDNDGDLDVVVNCLNAPALVYRNDAPAPRLGVRLKGLAPNTQGIGAKITVTGGPVPQTQQVISGGRYVSGDDPMRVFGCGALTNKLRIDVVWRSGKRSTILDAGPNQICEIEEASAPDGQISGPGVAKGLFEDASARLRYQHQELPFDDFQVQPGLPNRLSQMGPALAVIDFDGDRLEDVLIGGGKIGGLGVYRNAGTHFQRIEQTNGFSDDITVLAAWKHSEDTLEIVAGLNAWEGQPVETVVSMRLGRDGKLSASPDKNGVQSAIGALALTIVDGKTVMFAGGRFIRGRYPEPSPSYLFSREGSAWKADDASTKLISQLGSVTGAAWIDLNADGRAELVVTCDWGSVRVFAVENGALADRTSEWGLNRTTGRWLSLATGDFNRDGRPDLICGNWGENSFYNQAPDGQVSLYFGAFSGPDRIDSVEAFRDAGSGKVKPWRDMDALMGTLPWLRQRFAAHAKFAEADISEILGAAGAKAKAVHTTMLSSAVFLNRGARFEVVPLPRQAQHAPVSGIAVADFTGDGEQDIYLAQNYFAVRPDDPPLESGRGLLLEGKGGGVFRAMSPGESGISVSGEQRGCIAVDFDRDGRVDIITTQNGGDLKLYRNARRGR